LKQLPNKVKIKNHKGGLMLKDHTAVYQNMDKVAWSQKKIGLVRV